MDDMKDIKTIEECKKYKYQILEEDGKDYLAVKRSPKSKWIKICNPIWYDGFEDSKHYIYWETNNYDRKGSDGYDFMDDFIEDFIKADVTLHVDYPIPFRPLVKGYISKRNKGTRE